jgi:hypothetical protein
MQPRASMAWSAAASLLPGLLVLAAASARAQEAPIPEPDQAAPEAPVGDPPEEVAAMDHEEAAATPDPVEPSAVVAPFEIPVEDRRPPFVRQPETPALEAADDPVPHEELRFWGVRDRAFVSGVLDVGLLFVRPRFQFGYGTPHEMWGGLQIDPIVSTSGLGLYGGLRAEIPHADFRIGGRYRYSFGNSFLQPLDGYDHLTFRDRSLPSAAYLSWEAQASFEIPIDSTAIVVEGTATYLTLAPDGDYVFEESLRVISPPGFIFGGLLGYRIRFGEDDAFYVTPQVEVIHLAERGDNVLRAGLRAGIRLWPDLEVRLIAMPAWYSPDRLGAAGGDTFLLGVRYLWATDAPRFGH